MYIAYFHGSKWKPTIACVQYIVIVEECKCMADSKHNHYGVGFLFPGLLGLKVFGLRLAGRVRMFWYYLYAWCHCKMAD